MKKEKLLNWCVQAPKDKDEKYEAVIKYIKKETCQSMSGSSTDYYYGVTNEGQCFYHHKPKDLVILTVDEAYAKFVIGEVSEVSSEEPTMELPKKQKALI